mmetsp:Transcript_72974/g.204965  ORF Transcript_72974/g.204965 Transcript_72974/m.204965 type:complete len:94 (-) Transcript_72974:516-797(-)
MMGAPPQVWQRLYIASWRSRSRYTQGRPELNPKIRSSPQTIALVRASGTALRHTNLHCEVMFLVGGKKRKLTPSLLASAYQSTFRKIVPLDRT